MPKENLIPIENKKPFEIVHEVKNEVPSFEEFMKTYESDENLNYDDLSYSDISDKGKGYGPCEKYCGWNNPKCTCYVRIEEGFMPLNTSCPACAVNSDGSLNFGKPSQWVHLGCGGQSYISRRVRLKCFKCGTEGHWKQWSFKCGRHGLRTVSDTSARVFSTALSIAAGSHMNANDNETRDIIADIGTKLWEEFRNER